MSSETFMPPGARNQTEVFAVHGADPEVLAYAMAKYSRSALSMRESLAEISRQRAELFPNPSYHQPSPRPVPPPARRAVPHHLLISLPPPRHRRRGPGRH